LQVTLNLPNEMFDIYVADITKCFESIMLTGPDNFLDVVTFIVKTSFREAAWAHPRLISNYGLKLIATMQHPPLIGVLHNHNMVYGSRCPWILLGIHAWLMTKCMVTLGDQVWHQTKGIPIWNLIVHHYGAIYTSCLMKSDLSSDLLN